MAKKSPNISFDEVTLCVGQGQEKKNILNKISGSFPSGNLIGILGPSGAGKTSLLNILSGWGHQGKFTGEIKVNGKPLRWKSFKSISCYITQDSHLNDSLSIEENMTFAADLKLGPRISQNTKYSLIKDILESFGLTECKDTITSDLSGGQRKRLAICLELLSDPDVIFLDEPTTGLDIVSMLHCMRYLKNLALEGNTVVCTLNQPPDQIFEIFDIVYIISNGKCAYQGGSKELVSFLDYSGVPCEIFRSPLDFSNDQLSC